MLVQIMIPRKTHLPLVIGLLIFMLLLGAPHALLMYREARINSYIVASHLTWGSVITVAVGQTNGGLGDCGRDNDRTPITMKRP